MLVNKSVCFTIIKVEFETKTSLEKEKVRREGQNYAYREILIHTPLGMCPEKQFR